MSLNIKSPRAHQLAKKLAQLTGESMTEAVTVALEQRLEALQRESPDHLATRILELGASCEARWKEPWATADHGDLLYDDLGLPK